MSVLDQILTSIQGSLDTLHVPYSYGWSIILLTLLTKVITFPFTKIQVRFLSSTKVVFTRPLNLDSDTWYEVDSH